MNVPAFAVDLGGGLFMDSDGSIHQGAPSNIPVYPLPGGGLPINPDKIKKSLDQITVVFPDPSDPKKKAEFDKFRTLLGRMGIPDDLIYFLGSIGKMAAVVASVLPVVGFAVTILNMLGLFDSGPDPLEALINKRFDQLENLERSIELQNRLNFITPYRVKIIRALNDVKEYIEELQKYNPTPSRLETLYRNMLDLSGDVFEAVMALASETTWLATMNQNNYSQTWGLIQAQIHTMPPGVGPTPRRMPAPNDNRFDHRMMTMNMAFAVNSYLNLIKTTLPEYRTTGDFDNNLRSLADAVDRLAVKMREETLARTIYIESDFRITVYEPYLIMDIFGIAPLGINPEVLSWPVGALDLCQHTNAFLNSLPFATQPGKPYKKASFDYRWVPHATFSLAGGTTPQDRFYWITNSQECADEANAQSEADYPDLLVSSGYLNLAQSAATLRHLATEPDVSETVSGNVLLSRIPGAVIDVTVKSESTPLTPVIESPARLAKQAFVAHASLKVQPNRSNEQRAIQYRILLRAFIDQSHDTLYEDYYSTGYVPDPDHPGFKRLEIHTLDGWVVSETKLIAGSSRGGPYNLDGAATFEAYTYDWFIPVREPWSTQFVLADANVLNYLESLGWEKSSHANQLEAAGQTVPVMPFQHKMNPNSYLDTIDKDAAFNTVLWEDGSQTWEGVKRNRRKEAVQVEYNLRWNGSRVEITLRNRVDDRNYLIYLVVEETLPSGQKLHTAYPVPVVGQLTYVPESFLKAEKEANERAARVFAAFNRHYAISVQPGPGDPIIGQIRPGDLIAGESLSRVFALAEQVQPDLLREAIQEVDAEMDA